MTTTDTLSRQDLLDRIAELDQLLARAESAAYHHRQAALMHLERIELLRDENARLRAQLHGSSGNPAQHVKRLEDQIALVWADNTRLKRELRHAVTTWRTWQHTAQIAPFVPTLIHGRKAAPVVG